MVKRWIMAAGLSLCALLLLIPMIGMFFSSGEVENADFNENRALAQWPKDAGNFEEWSHGVEDYINDHLFLRARMIETTLHMNLALGESPDGSVMIGRDRWLYYTDGGLIQEDIRRLNPLSQEDLADICQAQRRSVELAAMHGVDYRILIAPDKQSVYAEYLPLNTQPGPGPSRMEQMIAALEADGAPVLPVLPALIAAKSNGEQYYRGDTHWNQAGGYTAYRAIMDVLMPAYPNLYLLSEEQGRPYTTSFDGDLSGMVGLADTGYDTIHALAFPVNSKKTDLGEEFGVESYVNPVCSDAPTMLLRCDSFGGNLIPYLRESVSVLYVTNSETLTTSMLAELKPDIFIAEIVERDATWLFQSIDDDIKDAEEEDDNEEVYEEDDWF